MIQEIQMVKYCEKIFFDFLTLCISLVAYNVVTLLEMYVCFFLSLFRYIVLTISMLVKRVKRHLRNSFAKIATKYFKASHLFLFHTKNIPPRSVCTSTTYVYQCQLFAIEKRSRDSAALYTKFLVHK